MRAQRRWADLSRRQRRLLVVGAAVEGVLKVAALRDLRHRPTAEIRGPKALWGTALVLVNSVGAVPIAYFLVGRRTQS